MDAPFCQPSSSASLSSFCPLEITIPPVPVEELMASLDSDGMALLSIPSPNTVAQVVRSSASPQPSTSAGFSSKWPVRSQVPPRQLLDSSAGSPMIDVEALSLTSSPFGSKCGQRPSPVPSCSTDEFPLALLPGRSSFLKTGRVVKKRIRTYIPECTCSYAALFNLKIFFVKPSKREPFRLRTTQHCYRRHYQGRLCTVSLRRLAMNPPGHPPIYG